MLDSECAKGDAWSCLSLAQLLGAEKQFFDEIPLDHFRAANLAGDACSMGDINGCLFRAHLLPESEVEERQLLINQACRAGQESACRENRGEQEGDSTVLWLGSLRRGDIQSAIRMNKNQVKYCYEKELTRDTLLQGTVVAKFRINGKGEVDIVAAGAGTDMPSSAVVECVLRVVGRIRFPSPKGGGSVYVTYPFSFSAS